MEATCRRPRSGVIAAATSLLVMTATLGDFGVSQAQIREVIKPVKIVQIYGRDTLEVGELETFRVRVNAPYATAYNWQISDGTELGGNPIVYRFDQPGRYLMIATARNPAGRSVDTLTVTVVTKRRSPPPVAKNDPTNSEKSDKPNTDAPKATKKSPANTVPPQQVAPAALKASTNGSYTWVVGTYFARARADAVANSYRAVGFRSSVFVDSGGKGSTVFRVTLGRFDSEQKALEAKGELRTYGIENPLLHQFGGA